MVEQMTESEAQNELNACVKHEVTLLEEIHEREVELMRTENRADALRRRLAELRSVGT